MIIKSHIRGGFRSAAAYLKEQGQNEVTRLVEMSDPHVKDLDQAFRAMWAITDGTKVKKPLHHISINPMKEERLTDKQVRRICERLEEQYGYAHGEHQRVIVEHIKEGRQHFHVIWNRVNLTTGKSHWPYMHKKQSKITAREMEAELGLGRPVPRSLRKHTTASGSSKCKPLNRDSYALHDDASSSQPTSRKKRKGGKGDSVRGSGGGMSSALSVFKFARKEEASPSLPTRPMTSKTLFTGPNRRRRTVWVPIERRECGR